MKFFDHFILGLDIGSHSIKLVEVKQNRGVPIITLAKTIAIEHEEKATDVEIGKSLRKLLDMSKVHSKRVITAVSSSNEQVIMRPIFIPEMTSDISEDALRTSAKFEAAEQDYIPYDVDYALMNFDIIGEGTIDDKQGLEVFFVSAHRDLIGNRIQLLREVGLIPLAIDIDVLAIARLLGFTNQIREDEDIAIIDIGASKTSLFFYQHGKPYIYPHIPTAGNALTAELSEQLQLKWKKAEEYKKLQGTFKSSYQTERMNFSFKTGIGVKLNSSTGDEDRMESGEYTSDEVFDILQRGLEKSDGLCRQLQNRFEYYEGNFDKPAKIIVSGGTSQLASFDDFLASRFSIPVEKISYLEKFLVEAKGDVSDIEGNESLFATAVGLALKEKL